VVPEAQALRTREGTLRAQETRRVAIRCTVGLDVQVVAVWRSRATFCSDLWRLTVVVTTNNITNNKEGTRTSCVVS
jgi:hypothetical protein